MERARGTLTVLRTLPGQRRVPFLSPEQTAELRDARVRETVRYAAATVPYYRDLFAREGIDPRELRSAGDLARLPIVDRDFVYDNSERFRSSSPRGHEAVGLTTSGVTTGLRLQIFHDRESMLANIAYSERERAVEASFCGRRFRYSAAELRSELATVERVRGHYDRAAFRPLRPRHHPIPIEAPLGRIVETLNAVRPDVIRGYGMHLEALFQVAVARGIDLHSPKVVVYSGDGMTPDGRSFLERDLGIPVLSRYNAVEAFKIGYFCEAREGFHLHEDLCHVALVDAEGREVPPGESGEVVISNLVNRGTVLLNYRLGDLGRMTLEPCSCGRTFRRLIELEGKVAEVIHLPSGSIVHQHALSDVAKPQGVIRYQLVQHEPARFELKLMTVDPAAFDRVVETIAVQVRELLEGAAVDVTYHELLDLDQPRKFPRVVLLPRDRSAWA